MFTTLLAAVPNTPAWSLSTGLVMILSNVAAIALASRVVKYPNVAPQFPVPIGLGVPAFIGAVCFGHLLGTGIILGLANLGVL
ncbi:MAG: photosystem I reaction center subunit PsaK [Cyanobacteria bacterium CRU_2_1]|nr:photosystem I reaction center subunit PsaK [Cyanobacteria bacterium RU_5_0]NJR57560.1 photosystem I reaction center subunit PsaK [Cyanobacteria bacterium CRU_2_1]